jgi:pimeloyl-ACP methyl ester carboxylesterase
MVLGNGNGERLTVRGIELEAVRRGAGRPILLLHGFQTVNPTTPFLELLAHHGEVVAPSGPGFGHSPRPKDFDTVYDLVHLYLELLDTLPGDKVTLLGFSFGGWLAAEVAVACSHRLDKLSDETLVTYARNREALCLYAWHPYMYNPHLPRWLGRIKVPTLLLWGESDGVVTPDYGRTYSGLIPGSRFELIERAGHHPEIEQPETFVERVSRFLEE